MRTGNLERKLARTGYRGELRTGERLALHTSLRVGGPAALFARPSSVEDLVILTGVLDDESVPWMLLGGGTNVIFANGGYHGCVIKLPREFAGIARDRDRLEAGASAPLAGLVALAGREGLSGLEGLVGIPGTVGGALRMNAGSRAGEIGDVVEKVRVLDEKGDRWLPGGEVGFGYRCTELTDRQVVLGAVLRLEPGDPGTIRAAMERLSAQRRQSQPSSSASAGCWFKNPPGQSAGRLIDEAGLKGRNWGGARVSEVHANFLVNTGNATTADFLKLAEVVRHGVQERFGIVLEEEVKVIHD